MDKTPTYKFIPEADSNKLANCPIQVTFGEFEGIIYRYGKISLKELENEELSVTMDIEILKAPENFDKSNQKFTNVVGEIFAQIVESGVEMQNEPIDLEDDVHQDQ